MPVSTLCDKLSRQKINFDFVCINLHIKIDENIWCIEKHTQSYTSITSEQTAQIDLVGLGL